MAGTRLVIQSIFVVEFLILVVTALFFGLYNTKDPISFNLPVYQKGRIQLRQILQQESLTTSTGTGGASAISSSIISIPLIRIATTKEYEPPIQQVVLEQDGIQFQVNSIKEEYLILSHCYPDDTSTTTTTTTSIDTNDDNNNSYNQRRYSIWVCPPSSSSSDDHKKAENRIDIRNDGITYLYPSSLEQTKILFQNLMSTLGRQQQEQQQQQNIRRRKPLQLSLVMEHRRDWEEWSTALSDYLNQQQRGQHKALQSWPCIRRGEIQKRVVLSTLVEEEDEDGDDKKKNKSSSSSSSSSRENDIRQISTRSMKKSVIDHPDHNHPRSSNGNNNAWNVLLYIPRKAPAQFVTPTTIGSAMYVDDTFVTTIDQREHRIDILEEEIEEAIEETITNDDNDGEQQQQQEGALQNETTTVSVRKKKIMKKKQTEVVVPIPLQELVAQAMAPVTEFLLDRCMGMSSNSSGGNNSSSSSNNNLPLWQLEAWLQRSLKDLYRQARIEIQQEGEWLLESSTWVVIDESVADHWKTITEWMKQVQKKTQTAALAALAAAAAGDDDNKNGHKTNIQQYMEALDLLEDVLDYVQALRTDPTLMEPLRFSAPQFLAIFAPLCLPLFLPHLIGLIREYKRYKKLVQGRQQQQHQETEKVENNEADTNS